MAIMAARRANRFVVEFYEDWDVCPQVLRGLVLNPGVEAYGQRIIYTSPSRTTVTGRSKNSYSAAVRSLCGAS